MLVLDFVVALVILLFAVFGAAFAYKALQRMPGPTRAEGSPPPAPVSPAVIVALLVAVVGVLVLILIALGALYYSTHR